MAERLCAEGGFESLSIRAISDAAQVNIAAITYHFGGKAQLFEEMFKRRVVPLNEQRLALLDAALAQPPVTLEHVVRAFVEPPMRLTGTSAKGNSGLVVMQFLSRVFSMPGETEFLGRYYEPVRSRFILALQHQLPGIPLLEIVWRYNLMVGGIIYAMGGIERMQRLPAAYASMTPEEEPDVEAGIRRIVRFMQSGFAAAAG
ncbi:TetR/AcrR family transcriptional regulator [Variovorax sp. PBS-H4]|uniref:TetR/AcrR family transcriptional regulator n=1 Tax=Variovorax sp. PBS-H4 TaxID=434008 RepID=UPI001E596540|nr:TetR/AcrR family transcriptional regulator [Variovorax sp. PBS-H4]